MSRAQDLSAFANRISVSVDEPLPYRQLVDFLAPRIRERNRTMQTLGWISALAKISAESKLSLESIRRAVSDLAWLDRAMGNEVETIASYRDAVAAQDEFQENPALLDLTIAYFVSQRLRFDFRFARLRTELRTEPLAATDSQLNAMLVFAGMGMELEDSANQLARLRANHELDSVDRDIVLHALWFGTHLPDQADQILLLSDEMLAKGDASANVYFRRAFAFRRQGRLEHAMREINTAMDLLGPGANDVHQDYARERELISTTGILRAEIKATVDEQLSGALSVLDSRARTAEESVSRSLVGLVEVLGLFIALIGFLGAGAVTLFSSQSFAQQILMVVVLFVGSIGFFLTLRFVVRSDVWRRSKKRR